MVTKVIQARVMTSCPLCNFRQRVDRLTGLETKVKGRGSVLDVDVNVVTVTKGQWGMKAERRPVKMTKVLARSLDYSLAAKLLPLVARLRERVPEFDLALKDEIRHVVVVEKDLDVEIEKFARGVVLARPVEREQLVPVSRSVEWQTDVQSPLVSEPMPVETSRNVPVSRGVEA